MKTRVESVEMADSPFAVPREDRTPFPPMGNIPPDWMILAAIHYALGKKGIIVRDCCNWLERNWGKIPSRVQSIISFDLQDQIRRDNVARRMQQEGDNKALPLGTDRERGEWERAYWFITNGSKH